MNEFRVLVCGGRDYGSQDGQLDRLRRTLDAALDAAQSAGKVAVIIHGNARGADLLADQYAREKSIRVLPFPADWNLHGRRAGPIRNIKMLTESQPHVIIAFKGGDGTAHMMKIGREAGVPVYEVK
jgi:predicted polyphosphate/ATP-dependent NAD kinase